MDPIPYNLFVFQDVEVLIANVTYNSFHWYAVFALISDLMTKYG